MNKKLLSVVAVLLLAVVAHRHQDAITGAVPWFTASQPVSVMVVEETKDRTVPVANVLLGPTADAMRDKKLWHQYDKDGIPAEFQALAKGVKEVPSLMLYRTPDKAVYRAEGKRFPASDAALSALIKKYGGAP